MILGHELSAVVDAVGPDVTEVSVGDRVAVLPHLTAPTDFYARRNLGQFSPQVGLVGLSWHWGGMGERVSLPQANLVRLPDTVSNMQGALLEPFAVAVNAVDEVGLRVGETVLVTGAGPIGILTVLAARAAGAGRIFVYEPNAARLDHLKDLEDVRLFNGSTEQVLAAISEETEAGVDAAIECAGHIAAFDLCVEALRHVGTLALVGLFGARQPVDLFRLCEKGVRLHGCLGNDSTIGPRLTTLIANGQIPVERLVTGCIRLEDAVTEGFEALATAGTHHQKILIDMSL